MCDKKAQLVLAARRDESDDDCVLLLLMHCIVYACCRTDANEANSNHLYCIWRAHVPFLYISPLISATCAECYKMQSIQRKCNISMGQTFPDISNIIIWHQKICRSALEIFPRKCASFQSMWFELFESPYTILKMLFRIMFFQIILILINAISITLFLLHFTRLDVF